MHKSLFMAALVGIISVSLSEVTGSMDEDVVDPFVNQVRWKRGDDYGQNVGGPVAAGPPGPPMSEEEEDDDSNNSTFIDECPAGSQNSTRAVEIVKDSNNSRCNFEKRHGQVLSAVEEQKEYKQLKTVVCNSENECIKQCDSVQCTYFKHNVRDKKMSLAFLYLLDEETLGQDRFSNSDVFDSYIRVCRSSGNQTRHLRDAPFSESVQRDSLPRKRPKGPSPSPHSTVRSSSSVSVNRRQKSGEVSLPRKRPPGSSHSVQSSQTSHSSSHSQSSHSESSRRSEVVSLPRKRPPPGSQVIVTSKGKPIQHSVDDSYKKFLDTYGKKFKAPKNPQRAKVFNSNILRIDQLNQARTKLAGQDGAAYGLTPFVDLTHKEFIKSLTGAKSEVESAKKIVFKEHEMENTTKNLPSELDWRHRQGIIGRIRMQGECGSCYAFTSADLISAQNAIEGKTRRKTLSPQSIADCYSDGAGCGGARVGKVLQNVAKDKKGVPLEQCYQYQEKSETCQKANISCCIDQNVKWSELVDVSGPKEKDLMAALLQWGPVISIVGVSEAWQFYNGTGIIKASQCAPDQQNHAILLIGYNYQEATPYYIVKNSWSKDWGEKGYAKLEAGKNACTVARTVVTACAQDCDKVKDARARMTRTPSR